jgi:hypothetical protein
MKKLRPVQLKTKLDIHVLPVCYWHYTKSIDSIQYRLTFSRKIRDNIR